MKKTSIFVGLLGLLSLASCGNKGGQNDVPVYDLAAATQAPRMEKLKVGDVRFTALDTVSNAMFGERATIEGIIGDTLILRDYGDGVDRILLFNLPNGKLLGEINHMGQGPGEYTWLDNVYIDRNAQEVVLNTPYPVAHRYTLSDSLVRTYRHNMPITKQLTKGSLEKGVNFYEENEDGFIIRQANKDFIQTDSIVVNGYTLGYLSGELAQFGDEGAITMVDTLYVLKPGRLEKAAILNRGGKTITPEIEKELKGMPIDDRREKQGEYINLLGTLIPEGNLVMVAFSYGADEAVYMDFFRKDDGELLTHIPMHWGEDEATQGMAVEYEGSTLYVRPIFAQDGRWYAIVPESQVPGSDKDSNAAIISFTLTE